MLPCHIRVSYPYPCFLMEPPPFSLHRNEYNLDFMSSPIDCLLESLSLSINREVLITEAFFYWQITTFNISLVVHGTVAENNSFAVSIASLTVDKIRLFIFHIYKTITRCACLYQGDSDPYAIPKSMGIFKLLESPKNITTTSIAKRIVANHDAFKVLTLCSYFFDPQLQKVISVLYFYRNLNMLFTVNKEQIETCLKWHSKYFKTEVFLNT